MKRRTLLCAGAAMLSLPVLTQARTAAALSNAVTVSCAAGHFRGAVSAEPIPVARFVGIAYGSAPQARRFREAERPPRANELVDATEFRQACAQPGRSLRETTEDCLSLNIWTPLDALQTGEKRAVMVYIHGGAYTSGSATDPVHDGRFLAAQEQVVVVSVNHRLNVLGYLYLDSVFPELAGSGNRGQTDLVLALQWIQDNIRSFGGDPQCVTVFGQSGGGAKIATLMAMPAARGLFHRAITMSGQQVTASGPSNAGMRTKAFLQTLSGDPRDASLEALMSALRSTPDPVLGGSLYMGPVLDMHTLFRHPFWPNAPEQSAGIPMMLGNTISETRAFYDPQGSVLKGLTFENLASRIEREIKVDLLPAWIVAQFRARYPQETPISLFHRIVTASRSWRGQVTEAEARARARHPVYVYQLNFRDAKHTDDIALCLGTHLSEDPEVVAVSRRLMRHFADFARSGRPGWPEYDLAFRQTLVIDTQDQVVSDPRRWERELFGVVPYIQPGS